jgi:peptidoglycan/xylan/chitin deacetylase (PgdA/CDA1 family)
MRWSPPQAMFRWRATHRLTVLAYHSIEDMTRFADHLEYLLRTMRPVSLQEVIDACAGRSELSERAVLVTFDDGERSIFELGMPLLRERSIPAVALVVTSVIDTQLPFWWIEVEELMHRGHVTPPFPRLSPRETVNALRGVPDQKRVAVIEELRRQSRGQSVRMNQLTTPELRQLESAGIEVGNHSLTHACLSRCDDNKVRREIHESHRFLTEVLGHPPRSFAYPDGQGDQRVRQEVARAGYEMAFLFDHRLNERVLDPLLISRVRVDSTTTLDRLATIVSGLHPAIHHARGGH